MAAGESPISWGAYLRRILGLQCPRCGVGQLFSSWFKMNKSCSSCKLDLVRESGFYLGSIYFNYGMTVLLVAPTYVVLVLGLGYSRHDVVWPCVVFTTLFPLWFYRYARAMWLSVMFRVSSIDFTDANGPSESRTVTSQSAVQQQKVPAGNFTDAVSTSSFVSSTVSIRKSHNEH